MNRGLLVLMAVFSLGIALGAKSLTGWLREELILREYADDPLCLSAESYNCRFRQLQAGETIVIPESILPRRE